MEVIVINRYEKEVEQALLGNEKLAINQLKQTYTKALADVKSRLMLLQQREESQSVIYQMNYQKSLESQINAILGVLQQDNIATIQDFLNHMYEDGYIGLQYALMQQGVPVIAAISQQEVTKSLFKKIGQMTFADRLGANMKDFKKIVKQEITRGIASGSTYNQIAQQLSMLTGESLNSSLRIVRTEGHRISSEAKLTAGKKARQQGADIVKMWDATLDGKTRKNHRKLDGVWVEQDEYFEIGGHKAKAPGKFGRKEEDINCRCVLLNRPRRAVEKEKTRIKNAKIIDVYGEEVDTLIKTKNYNDYKKGYYKILDNDPEIEKVIARANKRLAGTKIEEITNIEIKIKKPKNVTECKDLLESQNIKFVDEDLKQIDEKLLINNTNQFATLNNKFPKMQQYAKDNNFIFGAEKTSATASCSNNLYNENKTIQIRLSKDGYKDYEQFVNSQKKDIQSNWSMPCNDNNIDVYTITHEYGHAIHNILNREHILNNPDEWKKIKERISKANMSYASKIQKDYEAKLLKGYLEEIKEIAKLEDKDVKIYNNVSRYGLSNNAECFAEIFANSQCGEPNILGRAMNIWLERVMK